VPGTLTLHADPRRALLFDAQGEVIASLKVDR
jgi:hypothetical protein